MDEKKNLPFLKYFQRPSGKIGILPYSKLKPAARYEVTKNFCIGVSASNLEQRWCKADLFLFHGKVGRIKVITLTMASG